MGAAPLEIDRYLSIADYDHHWVGVSESFAAMLGCKPREMIGRPTHNWIDIHPADLEERHRRLHRNGHLEDEIVLLGRDGRRVHYAYAIQAVTVAGEPTWVGAGRELDGKERPGFLASRQVELLTREEAAAVAKVSVRSVDRWVRSGGLHAVGTAGARRIRLADLLAFLGVIDGL